MDTLCEFYFPSDIELCSRLTLIEQCHRTSTIGQLLYGRLSDIWSRKLVLLTGLAIFFLGSLASSLAQTATQLIIFRCFTGFGGGGLMTVAQMIVSDVVPLRERGKYQGILVSLFPFLLQNVHRDTGCCHGSSQRNRTCCRWCTVIQRA